MKEEKFATAKLQPIFSKYIQSLSSLFRISRCGWKGNANFLLDCTSRTVGWVIISASFVSLFNAGKSINDLGRET